MEPVGRRIRDVGSRLGGRLGEQVGRASRSGAGRRAESVARQGRQALDLARTRLLERGVAQELAPQAQDAFVVGVHFAGDLSHVYQLEQWLWPLEELASHLQVTHPGQPVGILCRDAAVARHVAARTSLPVRFARRTAGLDAFMLQRSLRVVFYLNQATLNFQALRFPAPAHVHLSHGESEKISMISNQLKAYDYVFTAGPAARERILATLVGYAEQGGDSRMIDIGRPQLDEPVTVPADWTDLPAAAEAGPVVFFAPTWEGDTPSMAYGTLPRTGERIVSDLLAAEARVIYRPHPRTGVVDGSFREADERIRALVEAAPGSLVDSSTRMGWQFTVADACVTEMSSIAFDWLTTAKPLALLRPLDPAAEVYPGGIFDRVPSYPAADADAVAPALLTALNASAADRESDRRETAAYYYGAVPAGGHQQAFEEAVARVLHQRGIEGVR